MLCYILFLCDYDLLRKQPAKQRKKRIGHVQPPPEMMSVDLNEEESVDISSQQRQHVKCVSQTKPS